MVTLNMRVYIALLIAFILTILPLPLMVVEFRPPWVLFFVLYLQFYLPEYFSVTLLLILGLCLDVLLSTVIGEHAFALLATTWFAARRVRRFKFFSIVQQVLFITLFCLTYQLTIYFIEAFLGYHNGLWMLFGSTLLTLFLWPWIRMLADATLCCNRSPRFDISC